MENRENGGDMIEQQRIKRIEALKRDMNTPIKIYGHAFNSWMKALNELGYGWEDELDFEEMTEMKKYEETISEMHPRRQEVKDEEEDYQYIMDNSDPEGIEKFDTLVNEYNESLEEIKNKKDLDKFKQFYNRAVEMIFDDENKKI